MPKCYIALGKTGDICNVLPMLRMQQGKPKLMVAREFSGLLDGVSYVEPLIFDGHYSQLDKACELAALINGDHECICTQVNAPMPIVKKFVYGPAGLEQAVTTSFAKEAWRVAGCLGSWDDQEPLLFDRRDPEREKALVDEFAPLNCGGTVLFSMGGVSSPFTYAKVVRELLRATFKGKDWNLVDLAEVKAQRFYDLLGLYERAVCLITTDSAPLHLARAMPKLPVFAFVNDKPLLWNGSPWRPNHVFHCRYSDFPDRVEEFADVLRNRGNWPTSKTNPIPTIVHVWNAYDGRWPVPERKSSYEGSRAGAQNQFQWKICPIDLGACGRDSQINLKDGLRVPFLKDCLRMGLQMAGAKDHVCLTRPDTRFESDLGGFLVSHERTFAYRMGRKDGRNFYEPIADLFCARKEWWKSVLTQIPDLVLGRDRYWPHALWALFNSAGAHDATGSIWRDE